jgi:Family of unknown function (DUF5906)
VTARAPDAHLPDALAPLVALPRWLIWRWETKGNGRPTKVPYQARRPSVKAATDDPSTWSDYVTAMAAAEQADGIGFVITNSEIAAFDIDDCRDPTTGAIDPWAMALVARSGSYAEVTVSGTGIRIIGTAAGDKVYVHRKLRVANGVTVEPYRGAVRYIVMTGNALPGSPTALANIDAAIDAVMAEFGGANGQRERAYRADDVFEDIAPDDPRLAQLGERWITLGHDGTGIEKYGGDRSRAAFAFTCEAIRAGIDDDVIASCLMRWKIGEHVRDQNDVTRSLNRTLYMAREKVENSKLFEMNQQHAVLPIGGKTRVATWGDDPDFPGRKTIVRFSSFSDFQALYDKYRHTYQVDGETKIVPLGTWWISQPGRRQYDAGMRFMPESDEDVVNETLNLFQGFAVAPRKPEGKSGAAGCKLLLDHGLHVICSGNQEHFDYLIKREAFIAQRRTRSEIAVGLRTEVEGTGKGAWERALNRLYGVHAMQVHKPEHVIGKHNKHLETLLRLTADEALFAGDPRHRNALYGLITEPDITIEPKFIDAYPAKNHINIDITSNAQHFLHASPTARRMFIPTVSPNHASDHDYFYKIDAQLRDGGHEALLYHLLYEIDISEFNVRAVPRTAMLAEQAAHSRKGVDLLVETACSEGRVPCQTYGAPPYFSNTAGYEDRRGFDHFIDHHPDHDLARMGHLRVKRLLADDWGCVTGKDARRQVENRRVPGIIWPPLKELRAKFEAKHGGPQTWLSDAEDWQEEQF